MNSAVTTTLSHVGAPPLLSPSLKFWIWKVSDNCPIVWENAISLKKI